MLRQLIAATSIALVSASGQAAEPLQVKVYNSDSNSFNVTSVLVTGETEALEKLFSLAMLIPTFTLVLKP